MKVFDQILAIISVVGALVVLFLLVWQLEDMSRREWKEAFVLIVFALIWLCSILSFFARLFLKARRERGAKRKNLPG